MYSELRRGFSVVGSGVVGRGQDTCPWAVSGVPELDYAVQFVSGSGQVIVAIMPKAVSSS